jgi:hypothetical protein
MLISEMTGRLGFTQDGIRVYEDNESNKYQAATTRLGLMTMQTYNEDILKENRHLSYSTSVLNFFKSSTWTCASPPVLLDIEGDDPDGLPTIQVKVPLP